MAEGAELFFTAPFTSAAKGDKVADAGTAAAAAKAGVAAIVAPTAEEAAEKAAHIVGLLPANNLTGPAIFEFEQPTAALAVPQLRGQGFPLCAPVRCLQRAGDHHCGYRGLCAQRDR